MEQLRLILLNDVHKKIVENSAYPVLDSHWEKREKEVVYILHNIAYLLIFRTLYYNPTYILYYVVFFSTETVSEDRGQCNDHHGVNWRCSS